MSSLPDHFVSLGVTNANDAIRHALRVYGMPSSNAVANWITALATVLLVVGALLTALYARRTYLSQTRKARRAQAESVFTQVQELSEGKYRISVVNASSQPIYDLGVVVNGEGATLKLPGIIAYLMPGEQVELPREAPIKFDGFSLGEISATVRFTQKLP
jgi:hypothetical protein